VSVNSQIIILLGEGNPDVSSSTIDESIDSHLTGTFCSLFGAMQIGYGTPKDDLLWIPLPEFDGRLTDVLHQLWLEFDFGT